MRFQRGNLFMAHRPAAVPPSTMAEAFRLKVRIERPVAEKNEKSKRSPQIRTESTAT
jgi:hypothetical protein